MSKSISNPSETLLRKAISGSSSDLANYEKTYLAANFPELSTKGAPRLLLLTSGNVKESKDAFYNFIDNQGFLSEASSKLMGDYNSALSFIDRSDHTHHGVVPYIKSLLSGVSNLGKYFGSQTGHSKESFGIVMIDRDICPDCGKKPEHQCSTFSPDADRKRQMERLMTTEHEIGHWLSDKLGYREQRTEDPRSAASPGVFVMSGAYYPSEVAYSKMREESFADAYAYLRVIQMTGKEGLSYLKSDMNSGNFLPDAAGNLHHYTTHTLLRTFEWAEANYTRLQSMSGRQVAEQAQKLSYGMDLGEFSRLNDSVENSSDLSRFSATLRDHVPHRIWNLIGLPPDHIRKFDALRKKTDALADSAEVDLSKLNPLNKDRKTCVSELQGVPVQRPSPPTLK